MNNEEIIESFRSRDHHKIYSATWSILKNNDVGALSELAPYIREFEDILSAVDMGGMLRSNKEDTKLALDYLRQCSSGGCHCFVYTKRCDVLDPRKESEFENVKIESTYIDPDLKEDHFIVECLGCGKKFDVREVYGGHYDWYKWKVIKNPSFLSSDFSNSPRFESSLNKLLRTLLIPVIILVIFAVLFKKAFLR